MSLSLSFLKSRPAQILTLVLLVQAGVYYGRAKTTERVPLIRPFAEFPQEMGQWRLVSEGVVEQEILDVLKADEILNRYYVSTDGAGSGANLFIAYFKSQRTGVAPHSPKNCMPGSGWTPAQYSILPVEVAADRPMEVNRYIVSKGESKSLVIYWYHSHNRTVASEYSAKIYTVLDSMRYNRSDTAIVRVLIPVANNDEALAEKSALDFVRATFPHLSQFFPA